MQGFKAGILNALKAKRHQVLRWLTLLLFSDLMLDVLRGFWHCTLWMSLVQIIRKRVLRSQYG